MEWVGGLRASRILDIPYRTLDSWIRSGLLDIEQPRPHAYRRFHFLDLLRAGTVKRLRAEGVSMQAIRKAIATLSENYHVSDPLAQTGRLLVAGERAYWAVDDKTVLDILKGQLAAKPLVILEVSEMAAEVRKRMAAA